AQPGHENDEAGARKRRQGEMEVHCGSPRQIEEKEADSSCAARGRPCVRGCGMARKLTSTQGTRPHARRRRKQQTATGSKLRTRLLPKRPSVGPATSFVASTDVAKYATAKRKIAKPKRDRRFEAAVHLPTKI